MNVYWLTGRAGINADEGPSYFGTLAEAHNAAKDHVKVRPQDRDEIRIDLREVVTDKAAILRMLNDAGGYQSDALRTWALGARGGLVEVKPGE